jgi:hypothetical protein
MVLFSLITAEPFDPMLQDVTGCAGGAAPKKTPALRGRRSMP